MGSIRLEECGRVLISTDHRIYAIDCSNCDELYTQWDLFLTHIKVKHKPETMDDLLEADEYSELVEYENAVNDNMIEIASDTIRNKKDDNLLDVGGDQTESCEDGIEMIEYLEDLTEVELKDVSTNTQLANNLKGVVSKIIEQPESSDHDDPVDRVFKSINCIQQIKCSSHMAKKQATALEQINLSHKDTSQYLQCDYCEKIFMKRRYLSVHLRRHTKEYHYKCALCNKLTVTSAELQCHMRSHTGEKPYACDNCGKCFKTSSVLAQHQRTHRKPGYQCRYCAKAYFSNYKLKNHINMHLKIRDFECEHCSKTFTSATRLYAHKMCMHSELRPNYCTYCRKCIPNVEFHIKTMHSGDEYNRE